ncbi:MAG TPA: hypothetical protein PLP56_00730 [Candidatus Omnitrophota bacterium]|nr:hypothetical protein [Candidatus Omnitrophota bacterium]HQO37569.1 hypothetical protein [Candidatus Omnitrophota bacterium]HQQ05489.1 hypothetical protein [Candidatus Omnitrophota bacterium]
MNKFFIALLVAGALAAGSVTPAFASDWDKAGKVLAVTEGLRIVTGGAFDLLGSITGVKERTHVRETRRDTRRDTRYGGPACVVVRHERRPAPCRVERVWVPNLVWKEKFVPEHSEYRPGEGTIWIGSHYEKYQVEAGGHWEEVRTCR